MASPYTVKRSKTATATAGSPDIINFTQPYGSFFVRNDGAVMLTVTLDGTTPVPGADDQDTIAPGQFSTIELTSSPALVTTSQQVRIVPTSATCDYFVRGV